MSLLLLKYIHPHTRERDKHLHSGAPPSSPLVCCCCSSPRPPRRPLRRRGGIGLERQQGLVHLVLEGVGVRGRLARHHEPARHHLAALHAHEQVEDGARLMDARVVGFGMCVRELNGMGWTRTFSQQQAKAKQRTRSTPGFCPASTASTKTMSARRKISRVSPSPFTTMARAVEMSVTPPLPSSA